MITIAPDDTVVLGISIIVMIFCIANIITVRRMGKQEMAKKKKLLRISMGLAFISLALAIANIIFD